MSCLFGSGSKESQRTRDDRDLIERYRKEITVLKQDASRLEREVKDLRENSALQLSERNDDIAAMREENEHLTGQLEKATEKEEGVAEYTVSLIKEIAELKGKLRGSGGRDEAWRGDETAAKYGEEEIRRLKDELHEAKDEARGYSEEIGDLAKQISDLQLKNKEIQYLRRKLGEDDESSSPPGTSGGSGHSSFTGDSSCNTSECSEGINGVEVIPSASSSARNAPLDAGVITTVSLTSGFFGDGADESITLSKANAKDGTPTKAAAAESSVVVTPPGTGQETDVNGVSPIDAEAVANAVKCVEELIRRVNQTKATGSLTRKELFKKRTQCFDHEAKNIEFVGMPSAMGEGTGADPSMVSGAPPSSAGKKSDSDHENSSFYSAASGEGGGKVVDCSSLHVAVDAKSPSQSTGTEGILDTSSWKPVGTTGALLLVSDTDESTINTEDAESDYEDECAHSAYTAPVSGIKARNDSAVIVAELYRVQSLLSSVLKSTANESTESEEYFSAKKFVRANSLPSFGM